MTNEKIAEILARAKDAAPGPWRTFPNPYCEGFVFVAQDFPIEPYPRRDLKGNARYPAIPAGAWAIGYQLEPENGNFIAAARTDVPALCDALLAERAAHKRVVEALRGECLGTMAHEKYPTEVGCSVCGGYWQLIVDAELHLLRPDGGECPAKPWSET